MTDVPPSPAEPPAQRQPSSDPMDGFILQATKWSPLSPGGKSVISWIVIADSPENALERAPMRGATIAARGQEVLDRAYHLGLREGEFRRVDI